jgi:hypothetical protein
VLRTYAACCLLPVTLALLGCASTNSQYFTSDYVSLCTVASVSIIKPLEAVDGCKPRPPQK